VQGFVLGKKLNNSCSTFTFLSYIKSYVEVHSYSMILCNLNKEFNLVDTGTGGNRTLAGEIVSLRNSINPYFLPGSLYKDD